MLKLSNEEVEQDLRQFAQVYPVNYNCPGQVSVACAKEQLAPFSAAVKAAGGRALPLKVRGGFHSPFMATAAQGFAQVLEECRVGQPEMPLYSNRTGGGLRRGPQTFAVPADCLPGSVGDHRAEYDWPPGGHLCGAGAGQDPVRASLKRSTKP